MLEDFENEKFKIIETILMGYAKLNEEDRKKLRAAFDNSDPKVFSNYLATKFTNIPKELPGVVLGIRKCSNDDALSKYFNDNTDNVDKFIKEATEKYFMDKKIFDSDGNVMQERPRVKAADEIKVYTDKYYGNEPLRKLMVARDYRDELEAFRNKRNNTFEVILRGNRDITPEQLIHIRSLYNRDPQEIINYLKEITPKSISLGQAEAEFQMEIKNILLAASEADLQIALDRDRIRGLVSSACDQLYRKAGPSLISLQKDILRLDSSNEVKIDQFADANDIKSLRQITELRDQMIDKLSSLNDEYNDKRRNTIQTNLITQYTKIVPNLDKYIDGMLKSIKPTEGKAISETKLNLITKLKSRLEHIETVTKHVESEIAKLRSESAFWKFKGSGSNEKANAVEKAFKDIHPMLRCEIYNPNYKDHPQIKEFHVNLDRERKYFDPKNANKESEAKLQVNTETDTTGISTRLKQNLGHIEYKKLEDHEQSVHDEAVKIVDSTHMRQ